MWPRPTAPSGSARRAASESYLSIEAILRAAPREGAGAVHPGYGFLAESASFAEACESAGLVFVGPQPAVIDLMGRKDRARQVAVEAGSARSSQRSEGRDRRCWPPASATRSGSPPS